jgi:hypothetical protein
MMSSGDVALQMHHDQIRTRSVRWDEEETHRMLRPAEKVIKRLFAMSGNVCAFPECVGLVAQPSGTITAEICHIRAQYPGGPRFNSAQSEIERQAFENLILLCGEHHKVVDAEPVLYTVELLERMKTEHEQQRGRAERASDGLFAQLLLNAMPRVEVNNNTGNVVVASPGAVVGGVINIRTSGGRPTFRAVEGMIGASGDENRYVQYLIKRYNDFASKEPSRSTKFNYGVIRKNIESKFRVPWQSVSLEWFPELCLFLQGRINRTRIGKSNASKGHRSFSTFEEFVQETSRQG